MHWIWLIWALVLTSKWNGRCNWKTVHWNWIERLIKICTLTVYWMWYCPKPVHGESFSRASIQTSVQCWGTNRTSIQLCSWHWVSPKNIHNTMILDAIPSKVLCRMLMQWNCWALLLIRKICYVIPVRYEWWEKNSKLLIRELSITQINLATDLGLIVFCWGDDNNSKDTIQLLKSLGIHGIIYDKMDVLSTKEVKVGDWKCLVWFWAIRSVHSFQDAIYSKVFHSSD